MTLPLFGDVLLFIPIPTSFLQLARERKNSLPRGINFFCWARVHVTVLDMRTLAIWRSSIVNPNKMFFDASIPNPKRTPKTARGVVE